jgi:hypothetical protein
MSNIVDMIRTAVEKDASGFETNFDSVMASKMDAALQATYDSTYNVAPVAEAEPEQPAPAETELETEE